MNEIEKCISEIVSECNKETVKTCIDQDMMNNRTSDENSCTWSKHEQIGNGQTGVVYSICCNDNCNYIVKVIKFKKQTDKDAFLNEVNIQQQFYNDRFAPRIIAACYCKHEGVIVMEKVQLLGSYLESYPTAKRKEIFDDLNDKYVKQYKYMLTEKGLIHNDTNPGNIAISLDGKKPLMIDFGLSRKTAEGDDLDDLLKEFKMSLKMILNGRKGTVVERKPTKTRSRVDQIRGVPESDDNDNFTPPSRNRGLFESDDNDNFKTPPPRNRGVPESDDNDNFKTPSPPRKAGIRRLFE